MSNESKFDMAVIGGGPGGYVAAIRGAQLGLKVALVEKRRPLGGTCLNVGCIPSKALLHLSEHFHFAAKHAADSGIETGNVSLNLDTVMKKKEKAVKQLTGGIDSLVKKREIARFVGHGKLVGQGRILVAQEDGEKQTIQARNIVLATGSAPIELPFLKFDGKTVIHSDHAIALEKVPQKLVVIGAGAIGLELGSVWSRYGSEVTFLEFLPKIAAGFDEDIAKLLQRAFKKQGMAFHTSAKVTGTREEDGQLLVVAEKDDEEMTVPADQILVAVGRRPYYDNLGLNDAGVELDEDSKRIKTDKSFKTSATGIYAIGDVIAGPMLAHKAEEEGVAVAELIAGEKGHVNYDTIPSVIYTDPEAASVGLTEEQAKKKEIEYKVGKFPLSANGRALATDATEGIVKIIADAKTDRILGAQVVAKGASEMIAEIVAHMEYGGSAEDLGRTVHAHPTLSEAMKEAGLAVSKSAIHAF